MKIPSGIVIVFLSSICLIYSQQIFPNVFGKELRDSLVFQYKTSTVFSYDKARDTLFTKVYKEDDSLNCVYTGYRIYLNPSEDPTTYAFNNGVTTEHSYPQSKGSANGNAKSDMHHLFPVNIPVNSSRSNTPYAEIPDSDTDKWFRDSTSITTTPTAFIDEYSEKENDVGLFEPREDFKGNVARAIFYFYTMYQEEADQADSQFFAIQKDVLFAWHRQDPVDAFEDERNIKIAGYQGKLNPFVLDSSLVKRAYFPDVVGITNLDPLGLELTIFPNPVGTNSSITISVSQECLIEVQIYSMNGVETIKSRMYQLISGLNTIGLPNTMTPGIYFVNVRGSLSDKTWNLTKTLLVVR